MKLDNLLTKFKSKEEPLEYFFALEIDNDSVKSAVWTVDDGQTKVIKIGPTKSWDGSAIDDLLNAVDQSISDASDNLQPEPNGVIFGLPESWINKDTILPEKKQFLKTISNKLELKPLGFVVTDTALIKYLKIEEGTPPSAIFLQIDSGEINLTLVKLGKVVGTELIGRSGDLGPDVEEGLSRFDKIDTLPSRMLLYDGNNDFEESKQQLISYDWEDKLPFIHFPKVEVLPPDTSIKAVALAGGSEVAKSLGFIIAPHKKSDSSSSSFQESPSPTKPINAKNLGFTNKDIADSFTKDQEFIEPKSDKPDQPDQPDKPDQPDQQVSSQVSPSFFLKVVSFLNSTYTTGKTKLLNLKSSLASSNSRKKTLIIITIAFFLVFTSLFAAYWYLPKAKIILVVEPKTIEENLTITIDPQATSLDAQNALLPGQSLDISIEGVKSTPTTGTNLIGDPAKGDITILNKTTSTKTFAAGSVLIGSDNFTFTLDEEATVASRSSEEDSEGVITITPGKVQAKITAKNIGPESNLSAGSKLTFSKFSQDDYSAKTDTGLSGGTAREVKAVSKDDQASLAKSLAIQLQLQAQKQVQNKLGSDITLLQLENQDEFLEKTFSHAPDEEADNLNLEAKLEYTALGYHQADLNLLLQEVIKEKIPENFTISDASQIELTPASILKDGTADVEVTFKAKLVPKLDFTEIKKNLAGRYPEITQEYLATLPSFVKADITITPNLPQKLKTLPRVLKNIIIEVKVSN